MNAIGLDVGGTRIKTAVLCFQGEATLIVDKRTARFPVMPDGRDVLVDDVWRVVEDELLSFDRPEGVPIFVCCQTGGAVGGGRFYSWADPRCKVHRPTSSDSHRALGLLGNPLPLGDWLTAKLSDTIVGYRRGRLPWMAGRWRGHPVWYVGGDHVTAVHGVDLQDDEVSVNCGTGCQVSMNWHGHGEGAAPAQIRDGLAGKLACVTHLPAGRALTQGLVSPGAAARWAAQAARTLRPFRKLKLSGGVCEAVDWPGRWDHAHYVARNDYNGNLIEELGVAFEIVEDAAFKGLAKVAKEVLE